MFSAERVVQGAVWQSTVGSGRPRRAGSAQLRRRRRRSDPIVSGAAPLRRTAARHFGARQPLRRVFVGLAAVRRGATATSDSGRRGRCVGLTSAALRPPAGRRRDPLRAGAGASRMITNSPLATTFSIPMLRPDGTSGGQDGLRAAVTVTVARAWEAAAAGEFVEGPSALVPQPRDRHARRSAVRSGSGSGGKIVTPSSDGAGGRCGCRRCASWESRMGSSLSPSIRAWRCLRHEPHRRRALRAAEHRPPEVRLQQAGSRVQRAAVRAGRAAACARNVHLSRRRAAPLLLPRRPTVCSAACACAATTG